MIGDERPIHGEPGAHYFGGRVERLSLVPTGEAQLGRIKLADWVSTSHTDVLSRGPS
jgi:hypothetical protein